jgi:hypothetical protein
MAPLTAGTHTQLEGRRSRRLRRGLVALGIAVALPVAFGTSPAAADTGETSPIVQVESIPDAARDSDGSASRHGTVRPHNCLYGGAAYSSGSWLAQGSHETYCSDGIWYTTLP